MIRPGAPAKRAARPRSKGIDRPVGGEVHLDQRLVSRFVETPVGPMVLAASSRGLALSEFDDGRGAAELVATLLTGNRAGTDDFEPAAREHLAQACSELSDYFAGRLTRFAVPLDLRAGEFELAVWQELLRIPYGRTTSYGAIAARLGRPGAARAVGRANGRNRVAIIVPCHRVVGTDRGLTGYGGGIERKRRLLELEGVLVKIS